MVASQRQRAISTHIQQCPRLCLGAVVADYQWLADMIHDFQWLFIGNHIIIPHWNDLLKHPLSKPWLITIAIETKGVPSSASAQVLSLQICRRATTIESWTSWGGPNATGRPHWLFHVQMLLELKRNTTRNSQLWHCMRTMLNHDCSILKSQIVFFITFCQCCLAIGWVLDPRCRDCHIQWTLWGLFAGLSSLYNLIIQINRFWSDSDLVGSWGLQGRSDRTRESRECSWVLHVFRKKLLSYESLSTGLPSLTFVSRMVHSWYGVPELTVFPIIVVYYPPLFIVNIDP